MGLHLQKYLKSLFLGIPPYQFDFKNGRHKSISCTHKLAYSLSVLTKDTIFSNSHSKSKHINLICDRILHQYGDAFMIDINWFDSDTKLG